MFLLVLSPNADPLTLTGQLDELVKAFRLGLARVAIALLTKSSTRFPTLQKTIFIALYQLNQQVI